MTVSRSSGVKITDHALTGLGFDQFGDEHRCRFMSLNKQVVGVTVRKDYSGEWYVRVNGVEVQPRIVTLGALRAFLVQLKIEGVKIP